MIDPNRLGRYSLLARPSRRPSRPRGPLPASTRASAAALALALSVLASSAAGQNEAARAESLFREGKQLLAAKKYDEACPRFAESLRLDPSSGVALALGLCYESAGKLASAWGAYSTGTSLAQKDARKDRATAANEKVNALEPQLARVTLAVAPETARLAGLAVRQDGVEVGGSVSWQNGPVDPGTHTLDVSAPGFQPFTTTFNVGANGDRLTVPVPPLAPAVAVTRENAPTLQSAVPPQDEGVHTPGAFHVSLTPAMGAWSLRDAAGKTLCTLPCSYWIDPAKKYAVERVALGSADAVRLPLVVAGVADGAEVHATVRAPKGSRGAGIGLIIAGAAVTAGGVALIVAASETTNTVDGNSPSSTKAVGDVYGVLIIAVGAVLAVPGVVLVTISEGWRLDARSEAVAGTPRPRVGFGDRGLELEAGGVTAWVGPTGITGQF
jgi:hypothetical protein